MYTALRVQLKNMHTYVGKLTCGAVAVRLGCRQWRWPRDPARDLGFPPRPAERVCAAREDVGDVDGAVRRGERHG